jgi:hypothetical protein
MFKVVIEFLRENPVVVWLAVGAGVALIMLTLALMGS